MKRMRPEDLGIGRLFEKVRDAVIVADAETQKVVLWNPAATNVFGYSLPEAQELRVEALVPGPLKAHHREGIARYAATGHGAYIDSHRPLDLPALKKGGEEIRIELSLSPIEPMGGDGGRFVLAIVRDITKRKRAEAALAEERNLLRTLIDNLPDFIFVKDTQSRFMINNAEHLRVLGATQQSEVLGKTDFDIFPRELAEGYYADEQEVIRSGEPLIGREEPVVDRMGERKWLSTTKVPLWDSSGEIVGLVGMSRDITGRRRAEEALRRSEERYRLVARATNEAIWDSDVLADRQIWNGAVETMFGYPAGMQTNTAWWEDRVHPEDRERVLAGIYEVLDNGGEMWSEEYRFRRADGEYANVIDRAYVVRDAGGEPVRLIGSMIDVTARKLAEEEIRHLNESLEKRVAERTAQLAERESRLRELLGKLVVAQEEERRRVAYEVHDGLAQMIVAVQQHLQAFAKHYPPDSSQGQERLDQALELAQQTVDETRRVIAGLRPTALDDFGLAAALRLQVEALRSEGWEIDYREALGDERLQAAIETIIYRVAQEALTNVRKHAGTMRVRLNVGCLGRKVRLRVRDWGRGFETALAVGGDGPGERVGIPGMEERIALLGGEFKVRSKPGAGTLIVAKVPLVDSEEDIEHG